MAYNKEEQEKKALAAIKRHKLITAEEVVSFIEPKRTWFFENLNDSDAIKKALEDNKIKGKLSARRKWADSDNPTLQIAYYKLLATEDELKRLTGQKLEHSGPGGTELKQVIGMIITDAEHKTDFSGNGTAEGGG